MNKLCKRCRPLGEEYFTYWDLYRFDVCRARELVADGRDAVEVDDDSVRYCVDTNRIHKHHVAHVDPKFPGIIAHVFFTNPDGGTAQGHVLIDGNHRAARCLREKRPFFAYVLTEEESKAILLWSPDKPPSTR
jgi:hypothetical protein